MKIAARWPAGGLDASKTSENGNASILITPSAGAVAEAYRMATWLEIRGIVDL
jgi:hypothetical protein